MTHQTYLYYLACGLTGRLMYFLYSSLFKRKCVTISKLTPAFAECSVFVSPSYNSPSSILLMCRIAAFNKRVICNPCLQFPSSYLVSPALCTLLNSPNAWKESLSNSGFPSSYLRPAIALSFSVH